MTAPLPMLAIEQLRQAALARLRAAVAAANANDPTAQPALAGVYVPAHRFEKLRAEKAPFIHVAAKSDGGAGDSRQLAQIDLVGTLHVNLFVAGKRGFAPDLDPQAAQIAQAIALVATPSTATAKSTVTSTARMVRPTTTSSTARWNRTPAARCFS
jgi:hypothetical protein